MADWSLRSPFPYFGGKKEVAAEVWTRLGNVSHYLEPFFGSGAVLFGRPGQPGVETVNDLDGFVANAWRGIKHDAETVASFCDTPTNENDKHANHWWLISKRDSIVPRLEADPNWFDAEIAGRWIWGVCTWIGGFFCDGNGAWLVEDGELRYVGSKRRGGRPGIMRQVPKLNHGCGVTRRGVNLRSWFAALQQRLRYVTVTCRSWEKLVTPSAIGTHESVGFFLDPPYHAGTGRDMDCYRCDSFDVADAVREWAIKAGEDKRFRIAVAGYEGEHVFPGWSVLEWKARGGFGVARNEEYSNNERERIWFSPGCLRAREQLTFF